jgi:hypothetical protein
VKKVVIDNSGTRAPPTSSSGERRHRHVLHRTEATPGKNTVTVPAGSYSVVEDS